MSLVNDFDKTWREMHVKSDVFCSASIVLPDKGARQLNVGGWSLDSTKGVRLYWPDGAEGVNGTNDWEENWEELSLQVFYNIFKRHCRMLTLTYSAGAGIRLLWSWLTVVSL